MSNKPSHLLVALNGRSFRPASLLKILSLLLILVFLVLPIAPSPVSALQIDVPLNQSLVLSGGESTNPRDYDPATTLGSGDKLAFSGLVSFDPKLNLTPDLAESWDVSADGTVYTFHLRENARFHDGKPVTASDVIYSWERAASPELASDTALTYLGDIVGIKEIANGQADHASGLVALDDHTLQVTIDAPKPYFLYKLTYPTAFILDKENVESGEEWYREPNGTGPYRLKEWNRFESIVYEANPDFYLGAPSVPYVVYQRYTGQGLRLYETNEIDMPFFFTETRVGTSRFHFTSKDAPSSEQDRLLKEIAPAVASVFQRIDLEHRMKKRNDNASSEQQRIARDVHDTLGHSLAYLRLRLDHISMEFNQTHSNILQQEVESLRDVAKEAYDQMRQVLVSLSPNGSFNLGDTLTNYAERFSQRANFEVHVHQKGRPRTLPSLIQRNIFYIFQETLTNIEKHAHACEVMVNLIWQETDLRMEVIDNGVGYDTSQEIPNGHFGLTNMNERALESNAELFISSQPGRGTCLALHIPYEEQP